MKKGDLVEICFPDTGSEVGIYVEPDVNSTWREGEEESYSRSLILWDGSITSIPNCQIDVINAAPR